MFLYYLFLVLLLGIAIFFLLRTVVIILTLLTEVPYLPSNNQYKKAIDKLDITFNDKVLDIGSGDGRVLIYASKKYPKSTFVGVEKNRLLVIYSQIKKLILNRKNLEFVCADVHNFDISEFDKIYIYLLPEFIDTILLTNKKSLKKGCTVVSLHYCLGKEFSKLNNIIKYPVKYRGKTDYIYKWVNK